MRTILISILVSTFCFGQSVLEKKLIGKWELIGASREIQLEPLSESEIDSILPMESFLTFKRRKLIHIDRNGNKYNSTYILTDSILTLGNRKYKLMNLTQNSLIYKTQNELFDTTYEFKRVE